MLPAVSLYMIVSPNRVERKQAVIATQFLSILSSSSFQSSQESPRPAGNLLRPSPEPNHPNETPKNGAQG